MRTAMTRPVEHVTEQLKVWRLRASQFPDGTNKFVRTVRWQHLHLNGLYVFGGFGKFE
jgi:hypothetical protein